jgi:hypothetical protein
MMPGSFCPEYKSGERRVEYLKEKRDRRNGSL